MSPLRSGYRAFDAHELLVHFVAERCELYEDLEIELVDLRSADLPCDVTVACGAALFAALEGARRGSC